jgi:glucose/arabinose dehydrogenase
MLKNFPNAKSNTQHRYLFTRVGFKPCFFLVLMLAFSTLLTHNTLRVNAQSAPQSLRSNIQIRNVMNTLSESPSVRIAKDPRNNTLYYLKLNGEIYQVNLASSSSTLVYSSQDHSLTDTQGMAIGSDGTIYLVGNTDVGDSQTKATIVKGTLNSGNGERRWSTLAYSAAYPKSKTAFDHRFNGVVVTRNNDFIYVNSGSRTDHGEIQSADGLYPNTREVGLTACIFRLPTNGQNIFLPNDRSALKAAGYILAEGIRNTFDMAFAPNGDLFGTENGPDRDMSEELNWLRPRNHYGFPWRIGGADNPQQFSNYNPAQDLLLDPDFIAVQNGYFYNDPTFPRRPRVNLTEPIVNLGPDADSFRDPQDGKIKDASDLGQTLSTFSAHRSPLGLVFDTQRVMSSEFNSDGFMLSFTQGDPTGETVAGPFKDPSQDLLNLKLLKVGNNYQVRTTRIVAGFSNPIDAEIIGNKIYVIEFGENQSIWEITMPTK